MATSGTDSVKLLKRVEDEGFQIDFNPPGDGMCFYASAGYQLGLSATTVKNLLFDYLRTHRFDVCITNFFHWQIRNGHVVFLMINSILFLWEKGRWQ